MSEPSLPEIPATPQQLLDTAISLLDLGDVDPGRRKECRWDARKRIAEALVLIRGEPRKAGAAN